MKDRGNNLTEDFVQHAGTGSREKARSQQREKVQ